MDLQNYYIYINEIHIVNYYIIEIQFNKFKVIPNELQMNSVNF